MGLIIKKAKKKILHTGDSNLSINADRSTSIFFFLPPPPKEQVDMKKKHLDINIYILKIN